MEKLEKYFAANGIKKISKETYLFGYKEFQSVLIPALNEISHELIKYGYQSKIHKSTKPDNLTIEVEKNNIIICAFSVAPITENSITYIEGSFSIADNDIYHELNHKIKTELKKSVLEITKKDIIDDFITQFVRINV
jgi:hypothetical protein